MSAASHGNLLKKATRSHLLGFTFHHRERKRRQIQQVSRYFIKISLVSLSGVLQAGTELKMELEGLSTTKWNWNMLGRLLRSQNESESKTKLLRREDDVTHLSKYWKSHMLTWNFRDGRFKRRAARSGRLGLIKNCRDLLIQRLKCTPETQRGLLPLCSRNI